MNEWISVKDRLPDENVVVCTKIDDEKGVRNEMRLRRSKSRWLYPERSVYVYYTPTHWKPEPPKKEDEPNA